MEDQASSLQLDLIDNGLSHNGNNLPGLEITDSFQSQKIIEHSIELDGSNGVNLLDGASSTTTEVVNDQISIDIIKKAQNSSNGVEQPMETGSIDNHQDDDLIRELEQFEGAKKDDDVSLTLPKSSSEENGSNMQDTSDLLKDLESDSPCPGPSESDIESTAINAILGGVMAAKDAVELMDVDQTEKSEDVQVDSTTESNHKSKCSENSLTENVPKKANTETTTEKPHVQDVLSTDIQKSTSEIDSDTESKLLQENSDGEVSMSDVVEAISSTSTVTKTLANDVTSEVKPTHVTTPLSEDLVVSSSGNVEGIQVNVEPATEVKTGGVSKDNVANLEKKTESKGDDEVSSNKVNETTEIMEQDLNETVEADRIHESVDNVTSNETTTQNKKNTSVNALPTNSSPSKTQPELSSEIVSKTTETVDNAQSDTVASSEQKPSSMEIDNESEPQCDDARKKYNGLPTPAAKGDVSSESKTTTESVSEVSEKVDSGKVEPATEPIPVERIFEIRLSYEENELKSLSVERLEKKNVDESASATETPTEIKADISSEPTKHTANGMVELCNFMIDHFSAIKKSLNVDEESPKVVPQRGRGSAKKNSTPRASPSQVTPKSAGKRSTATKRSLDKTEIDESEPKSKQAKNANNSEKSAEEEEEIKGDCCLARWTDRKYYAGRVIEEKPGNKFVVLFEDGASKVLSAEVIVFGTGNVLPLMDYSVHVLVADDTYEPGLVTKVDTEGEMVMYTVAAESKTVTCTASDLYLMEDQAKYIHNSLKSNEATMKTPETPSSKRTGRLPAKLEETVTTAPGGRSSRGKKGQPIVSPEPGFSGDADTKKSGRRSNKRPPPPPLFRVSESSDLSDSFEEIPRPKSPESAIEAISGVQPELQSTPKDSEIYKQNLIAEYLGNDPMPSFDDLLGPMPRNNNIFSGYHFILTCTIPIKKPRNIETNSRQFGTTPFFKEHLRRQIEAGGGIVYTFFENIPKTKYKNCKLIAHHPCTTAKYVQCLAANIMPLSHEWIIECCTNDECVEVEPYVLPSGWSIIDDEYKEWKVRTKKGRKSVKPLKNTVVLMASLNEEFSNFWQRVCKLAGSEICVVKSLNDVKKTTKGLMLTDEDFDEEVKLKAEHFDIPVVSTVWAVQSLIVGYACDPESNIKLKQEYQDDDF